MAIVVCSPREALRRALELGDLANCAPTLCSGSGLKVVPITSGLRHSEPGSLDSETGPLLFFNYLYIFTFFPVVLSSAAILYMVNRKRYLYYRGMILLSFVAALLFFAVYPLAPPRFMEFTGIIDSIIVHDPAWYGSRDAAVFYNEYAAMPSLHFSWTLLWGFVYWRSGPRILKMLGVLYPIATFFAIVVTGNHYTLDALGGAGMMLVFFFLYRYLLSGRLSRPPTAPVRGAVG